MPEGSKLSRLEQMQGMKSSTPDVDSDEDIPEEIVQEETQDIPLPDIKGCEYLVSFLHEAGTATQTGMGLVPLSWQEIEAWVRCSDSDVTPWELGVVKKLSNVYASEYSQATDPKRIQPFTPKVETQEIDRAAVAAKVGNILAMFMKKDNKGL